MRSFLDTVAADLYKRYGDTISELCLVFPNRRARLFFSQSLSRIIEKPVWQPSYKSIEELVKETSPLEIIDTFPLLVELYAIYCNERKTNESFDRFYYWGETLLHDFDQLDKYLVNAPALFTNLQERKILEGDFSFLTPEQIAHIRKFWSNFSGEKDSTLKKEFIAIWPALSNIYRQFGAALSAKGKAYEGMAYRAIATSINKGEAAGMFPLHYVFIGFNALNECEKTLFRFLQAQQQADFYWDYDIYYLQDEQQEAGLFLRDNIKQFPPPVFDSGFSPFSASKQITVTAAPSPFAQTKIVPQLVKDLPETEDECTAIVPADEQLLPSLLHSLTAIRHAVNITMGYPLHHTAIYTLLTFLLQLVNHEKRTGEQVHYYYKDILALLSHPYIKQLTLNDSSNIRNKIVFSNNFFVSANLFSENKILNNLLAPINNYHDLTSRLLYLMDVVAVDETLNEQDQLLKGYVQHIICQINKIYSAITANRLEITLKLYSKLLKNILRQERIPFIGEPLEGLQVMGLLETRSIDFDNVIVLSVNEGIFPHFGSQVSFIPYSLRKGFGLPTPEQQEAVWAYYFYRLLQRAKNVHLIYSTKSGGLQAGEASRYLLQLKMESSHDVQEKALSFAVSIPENQSISIAKSGEVQAVLARYCGENPIKKLSPSALNTYLECPLRFYFKYITRLDEPEEIAEKVDSKLFGILLHKSMEIIYRPQTGEEITKEWLEQYLHSPSKIKNIVEQSIAKEYYKTDALPDDFNENGDLLMVSTILHRYIRQLIVFDSKQVPFVLEGIEIAKDHLFSFGSDEAQKVCFGGIIDRLHKKGNNWYIVDYKTGYPDNEFESVAALFGDDRKKRHPAVLQTLLYSLILYRETHVPVIPQLYFLRESYNEEADFSIFDKMEKEPVSSVSDYAEQLTNLFSEKISELFDNSIPFTQTTDNKNCEYCPYRFICQKPD